MHETHPYCVLTVIQPAHHLQKTTRAWSTDIQTGATHFNIIQHWPMTLNKECNSLAVKGAKRWNSSCTLLIKKCCIAL